MYKTSKTKRPSWFLLLILYLSLFLFSVSIRCGQADPPQPKIPGLSELVQTGAQKKKDSSKDVTLDFDNVDIKLVIKYMSDLLNKNFLVDDAVKGKVTIISPQAIPVDEAYKVFESILEVKGFTAIPSGSIIKIVPIREAYSKNIETRTDERADKTKPEDTFITQLIPIEHADVNEVKTVISTLVSKESKLLAYGPTNTLILTETLSNIDRLLKIIKEIDVPFEETRVEIVPLKYASPDVISSEVLKALGEQKAKIRRTTKGRTVVPKEATQIKIIPDDRTGSLIIVADEEDMEMILDLIDRLDIPTPRGKDNIRVRPLKNAKAEDVAKVLSSIISQQKSQSKKGATEAGVLIEGSQVTADKATNALIITAPPQDYEIISRIIDELDVMRPQVLVEALIAEVTFGKNRELGVEWRAGFDKVTADDPGKDYLGFAGTNFDQIAAVQAPLTTGDFSSMPNGMFLGVAKGAIKVGGFEFPNIAALIRAYQGNQDVNILSTPHILTTDNEEATILIGQSINYPQSDIVDNITRQSYIYKDVGLTLKITPYINPDGYVKLEISLKIDNVIPRSTESGPPWTTKREAETTVVVKDRQTVVIGGLLKDDQTDTMDSVPCLGDIPFLGWAFRKMSKEKKKTNLQVFLTPHIIKTPEDLELLTLEKSAPFEKEDMKLDISREGEASPADTSSSVETPEAEQDLVKESPIETFEEGQEVPEAEQGLVKENPIEAIEEGQEIPEKEKPAEIPQKAEKKKP